jgi:DNA/RNA-binding domain of Phe-tRNA-synthetase-like protein
MEIIVDPLIIKTLKSFRLGLIEAKVHCQLTSNTLKSIIDKEVTATAEKYQLDEVNKIAAIAETRRAYKQVGNDPNRYRPSADSLIRRIVKGLGIYSINNVVDILNLISIQSGFSIGGYDRDAIRGCIELGIGRPGELYTGLGRGEINIANLPVLRDELGAFGTPTSDSERTMIKESTTQILFVFYDFGFNSQLETFLKHCSNLLAGGCLAENISSVMCVY